MQIDGLCSRNESLWTIRWEGHLFDSSRAGGFLRAQREYARCRLSNLRGRFCLGRPRFGGRLGRCLRFGCRFRVRDRNSRRLGQNRDSETEFVGHRFEHLFNRGGDDLDGSGNHFHGGNHRLDYFRRRHDRLDHSRRRDLDNRCDVLTKSPDFLNHTKISRGWLGRRRRGPGQARSGVANHCIDGCSCGVGQFCGRGFAGRFPMAVPLPAWNVQSM